MSYDKNQESIRLVQRYNTNLILFLLLVWFNLWIDISHEFYFPLIDNQSETINTINIYMFLINSLACDTYTCICLLSIHVTRSYRYTRNAQHSHTHIGTDNLYLVGSGRRQSSNKWMTFNTSEKHLNAFLRLPCFTLWTDHHGPGSQQTMNGNGCKFGSGTGNQK